MTENSEKYNWDLHDGLLQQRPDFATLEGTCGNRTFEQWINVYSTSFEAEHVKSLRQQLRVYRARSGTSQTESARNPSSRAYGLRPLEALEQEVLGPMQQGLMPPPTNFFLNALRQADQKSIERARKQRQDRRDYEQ